eukprot:TRINITY_DN26293_c2_g1_i1.p1 TRINITY_DN26293_c2_g1~~TRINITY_DN26293_c2_g1_i1.p1  ORF type:complete len:508 (-),score=124.15 TRINITY_DN26293_c2_g1_i1:76-1599(-)
MASNPSSGKIPMQLPVKNTFLDFDTKEVGPGLRNRSSSDPGLCERDVPDEFDAEGGEIAIRGLSDDETDVEENALVAESGSSADEPSLWPRGRAQTAGAAMLHAKERIRECAEESETLADRQLSEGSTELCGPDELGGAAELDRLMAENKRLAEENQTLARVYHEAASAASAGISAAAATTAATTYSAGNGAPPGPYPQLGMGMLGAGMQPMPANGFMQFPWWLAAGPAGGPGPAGGNGQMSAEQQQQFLQQVCFAMQQQQQQQQQPLLQQQAQTAVEPKQEAPVQQQKQAVQQPSSPPRRQEEPPFQQNNRQQQSMLQQRMKEESTPAVASRPPQSRASGPLPKSVGEAAGRTTVMLKNMPNNYSRQMLLELLDSHGFKCRYDFVYLPMDFNTRACLGYAFVNLVNCEEALRFWRTFDNFSSWVIPSRKHAGVSWSNPHQGLHSNIERYKNSPVMHEAVPEDFKPCLFNASTGEQIPFPISTKKLRIPRVRNFQFPPGTGGSPQGY